MTRIVVVTVLVVLVVACGRSQPPAAPPASGAPAASFSAGDLPEYPGATKISFSGGSDAEHGFASVTKATYTSTDAHEQVFGFYQRAISEGGWTVVKFESKPGKAEWDLARGMNTAEVDIEQETGFVEIKLEHKSR